LDDYKERRDALRHALLNAQFALRERNYPVIILPGGFDGSGRGALVHRLNTWMDPRLIDTEAFWHRADEESRHPYFWRFWRRMPAHGRIGILLGGWYEDPLYAAMSGDLKGDALKRVLRRLSAFERILINDGALIIKLWLNVSRKVQYQQLAEEAPRGQQNPRVPADADLWWHQYPKAREIANKVLRRSQQEDDAPWHVIEADDARQRDLLAGEHILRALEARAVLPDRPTGTLAMTPAVKARPLTLASADLSLRLERREYRKRLPKLQSRLQDLIWRAHRDRRSLVAVFEGWDAAGKGSTIRRVTAAMDPRLYKLLQFAAPTDEERRHHYLWRVWRQLQEDGRATLFDRSWYGRVLVERVEGFAREDEWRRAYEEINEFERHLSEHGTCVVKFWMHISPEEQLRRFQEREKVPYKQHKITPEDWRNRDRWPDYERAVNDMLAHTNTRNAPWHVIPAVDKPYARIAVLRALCDALKRSLKKPRPDPLC
jgi:polyphosphate:AMP phosphotransferase